MTPIEAALARAPMTERPILFSGEMIRALLDGRKTQTRRVVKQKPVLDSYNEIGSWDGPGEEDAYTLSLCPYGKPGDRLWVRETWRLCRFMDGEPVMFEYAADGARSEEGCTDSPDYEEWYENACSSATDELIALEKSGHPGLSHNGDYYTWEPSNNPLKWHPSIHMPRWASRITLQVTDVRVERVQDISEEDAAAEGVDKEQVYCAKHGRLTCAFAVLWDKINAKRGYDWDANPWVWVVKFEVQK